ncbi:PREDICTED: phospholipase A1-II 4-like [Ipomoea nil]|uniref:phospholipase A1-II 4-like n=1 Tax=Ipomoea nil TaxID=35883 RepID=UPI0009018659|nr:PREDICTED: phospholipase A1-II 4-like [Ipomoea nil]
MGCGVFGHGKGNFVEYVAFTCFVSAMGSLILGVSGRHVSVSGIAERWKDLSGSNNWEGLLDPLDSDLRRYLIHYGSMVAAVYDSFINEPISKNVGLCRYARKNLLRESGHDNGNPFKYEVTKYYYSPSTVPTPVDYFIHPLRPDAVLKQSNWMGYVAVAMDDGKSALGRRDILVAWRGTVQPAEWVKNFNFLFVKAPLIFGQYSDPLVHKGFYDMYTAVNPDPVLKGVSARDQIREEVSRLVEKYKDEEMSITLAGHSLGSSLATLTAVDLVTNPINKDSPIPVTAFLFASPKVGERKFKNAVSKLAADNLKILRLTDAKDIVPRLPPFGVQVNTTLPIISYEHVGMEFRFDASKSNYLDGFKASWHTLVTYLHGVDGFQGSQSGFKLHGDFDVALLNKHSDQLKRNYSLIAPAEWYVVKNTGMVQQEDGSWILNDHEVDDI